MVDNTTATDVIETFRAIDGVETYNGSNDWTVTVIASSDAAVGEVYGGLRSLGVDPIGKGRRVNGDFVARVGYEREEGTLAELFG
jgi:hypothetical protein